jgi:hypothetical protein
MSISSASNSVVLSFDPNVKFEGATGPAPRSRCPADFEWSCLRIHRNPTR